MHIMTSRGWMPLHRPCVNSNNVEGVFVERTIEEVQAMNAADEWHKVWRDYRFGVIGWNEWINHPVHKRKPYTPIINGRK